MARCTGSTVVVESPTSPTYTEESVDEELEFEDERGALTISVGDISICACGEEVAVTVVIYNGQFLYDGEAIYSGTPAE